MVLCTTLVHATDDNETESDSWATLDIGSLNNAMVQWFMLCNIHWDRKGQDVAVFESKISVKKYQGFSV